MNIVNICFYAEAYYSEAYHEENITITEELYEIIKEQVNNINIYVSDLDGKHSEVLGEIDIQPFSEEQISGWCTNDLEAKNDGNYLLERLYDICEDLEIDLEEDIKRVEEYCKSHVKQVINVKYTIPCDKKSELDKYVIEIGGSFNGRN